MYVTNLCLEVARKNGKLNKFGNVLFMAMSRNFTNTNLKAHLQLHHKKEYNEFMKADEEIRALRKNSKTSVVKQQTLEQTVASMAPYQFDHPRARKLHRAIAEMVCVDCLPFYTVEKPGFLRLIHTIEPRYKPCSRTYLSQTMIPSMYDSVKSHVAQLIDLEPHISITTDIWSSDSLDSYISFTAHWINKDWEYKEGCLHALPFNERHTGENIANMFTSCVDAWKIKDKVHLVLRDSGSNFVAGFRDIGLLTSSCFAHTLQLAVKDGVLAQTGVENLLSVGRKVVGHFKHSNVSLHALSSIQAKLELPAKRPIQDEPTRWNSSFYMLEWLMEQKQAILAVGAEINLPVELTNSHWQLMIRVLRVLRPFEEATKEASFGDASIGIVIPLVNAIVRQLEDCDQDDEGVRSMKRQLLASISTRFGNIESSKHFVMATVLDPRYKTRCFSSSSKAIAAHIMLVEESKECITSSDKPPSPK